MPLGGLGDVGGGIGGAIGGIAVLAGAGGKGGDRYYKEALEVWKKLKDPEFDMRELSAPQLRVFAEYFPEVYDVVIPQNIKTIAESPELRLSELRSLKKYERMADEGLPLSERLAEQEAGRRLAGEAARNFDTARADLARQGRLGSTDELLAANLASSQAAESARGLGADLAARSEQAKLTGLAGGLGAASGIRGEDYRAASENAGIMNRLAEYIANQGTEANRFAAEARGAAANANVGNAQRIGESNVLNKYATGESNLERRNRLRGLLADYQLQKASGLSGALNAFGLKKDQDKAAREQTIMSIGRGVGQAGGGAAGLF
jgi:hypothetical protein